MFSVRCKLCAFINTAVVYTDCARVYMYAILSCAKYQIPRRVRKHTFIYTKSLPANFQFFKPSGKEWKGKVSDHAHWKFHVL